MSSFPPCLTRSIDGIFRRGGGGSGRFPGRPWETCRKGNSHGQVAASWQGEICLADEFILETHGLTKEFAGFFAVRDVALKVRRGSIHALIGPEGAGKTPCFNLLTQFFKPSAGENFFKGRDINALAAGRVGAPRLVASLPE